MKKLLTSSFILIAFAYFSVPAFSQETAKELNHGYALLHQISSESKNTGMIFIVKNGSSEVHSLTGEADKIMSKISSKLENWANQDSTLDIKHTGQSKIERRASKFDGSSTKSLLMDSSGRRFNMMLTVVNYESVSYTFDLVKAILRFETNQDRRATLKTWSSDLNSLQSKIVAAMLSTGQSK